MGYYTNYEIEVVSDDHAQKFLIEEALKKEGVGIDFKFNDRLQINETKWYDHEDDIKSLSLRYPNVLFKLHGEGEEAGDLWNKYFLNGRVQTCKAEIVYPPFDKKKLA